METVWMREGPVLGGWKKAVDSRAMGGDLGLRKDPGKDLIADQRAHALARGTKLVVGVRIDMSCAQ